MDHHSPKEAVTISSEGEFTFIREGETFLMSQVKISSIHLKPGNDVTVDFLFMPTTLVGQI